MPFESDLADPYGYISLTNTYFIPSTVCPSLSTGLHTDEFILQV